ncbi:MAG: hypothetical protein WA085_09950, partial [Sphingobium sp.]
MTRIDHGHRRRPPDNAALFYGTWKQGWLLRRSHGNPGGIWFFDIVSLMKGHVGDGSGFVRFYGVRDQLKLGRSYMSQFTYP